MSELAIINYHYIRENFNSPYPGIFGIDPGLFYRQLSLLRESGKFISQKQLVGHIKYQEKIPDKSLMITFDDGLSEQITYALPILEKLAIPAVFYINSSILQTKKVLDVHKIHLIKTTIGDLDFISRIKKYLSGFNFTVDFVSLQKKATLQYVYDNSESALVKYILNLWLNTADRKVLLESIFSEIFPDQETEIFERLYMNKAQIAQLGEMEYLGSHGHDHQPLGHLSSDLQIRQLEMSREILEKHTGTKIYGLSFPYGTPEAVAVSSKYLSDAGYVYGLTVQKAINRWPFCNYYMARLDCNDVPLGKNYSQIEQPFFNYYPILTNSENGQEFAGKITK